MEELPEQTADPTGIRALYYLKKEQPEEALKLTQKQLYKLVSQVLTCLSAMMNPHLLTDPKRMLPLCRAYKATALAFGFADMSDGFMAEAYLLLGQPKEAAQCFARYVDILLGPLPLPDKALFTPGMHWDEKQKPKGSAVGAGHLGEIMVEIRLSRPGAAVDSGKGHDSVLLLVHLSAAGQPEPAAYRSGIGPPPHFFAFLRALFVSPPRSKARLHCSMFARIFPPCCGKIALTAAFSGWYTEKNQFFLSYRRQPDETVSFPLHILSDPGSPRAAFLFRRYAQRQRGRVRVSAVADAAVLVSVPKKQPPLKSSCIRCLWEHARYSACQPADLLSGRTCGLFCSKRRRNVTYP